MKRLYGMTCAAITPMNEDKTLDLESARRLYRHLAEHGTHCLYPNGTNGESLSLTAEERKQIASVCLEANQGKCVVCIQCGAATVPESYELLRHAQEIGADGAGLMTPVFFPTDELSMESYYAQALSRFPDLPIYAYNIPSRTGNDLSPDLFGRLCVRFENLYGVKYSAPDLTRIQQYVHAASRETDVLIGFDPLALPCLTLGGKGFVSGPGAVFTDCDVGLYQAFCAGDLPKAMQYQELCRDYLAQMSGMPEIPAIKYLLKRLGIIACDACREPLRPLTDAEKRRLDALLRRLA